ncbi:transposable element Tc1 transposase [Trichonephila clavipes]|nr:transposable element Tc1 transposase [Trichonephila clavipes]
MLVNCYRCNNVGFNSSTSAAPGIACKGDFIKDPSHGKPSTDDSHLNLWDYGDRIRVRRYAGERCLPECIMERHSDLTPGVMVWSAISYHRRSNLLRIEGNPGAIFQQNNARPHVAKTIRDLCSALDMQLLPRPAYSPNMSPIEQVWDLVGRYLARDLRLVASKKKKFWCAYKQYEILFYKQTFKICLTPCHVV